MAVVALGLYVVISFDIAFGMANQAILLAFTLVLQEEFGIHPAVAMTGAFICLHYMSPMALIADNILGGQGWKERDLAKMGLVYAVCSVAALLISVFYWWAIGIA